LLYKEKLLPGLAVELVVLEGEYEGIYRSRIEEVNETTFSVGAPMEQGELVPLHEKTKVRLIFWDKESAYALETKIIKRVSVPIALIILELKGNLVKIQRRSYFRVSARYPLTYQTVIRREYGDPYKATMLDLSGGGMRFLTEEPLNKKVLIYVQVALPNGDLRIQAQVRRVEKTEDGKRYVVSVEFDDITERERDRIIRCVFDIQRAMRKKGLV